MIYYYSISDFPATVLLIAPTFLSILPPSSCDYLCLPASLFCVYQFTSFIHVIVPAKLFLCAYFIIHFFSSALQHDFRSTDLVTSFSVCVYIYHSTSICVSVIAFVADCMPISFSFIHTSLMNSFLHQAGSIQRLSEMVTDSIEFHCLDRYD